MKKAILVLAFLANNFISTVSVAQVAINESGEHAVNSAMLDISSTNRGMLIPRMTESQRNNITEPAEALLVFQTDNSPGFYFWDGSNWIQIAQKGTNWEINGNSGMSSSAHYIGTTDMQPLVFRTNSVKRLQITPEGRVEMLNTGGSVFFGEGAGASDDLSSNYNTFIGSQAGNATSTGVANVGLGYFALNKNTIGRFNTANGYLALYFNTLGNYNTASGSAALYNNTIGAYNVASGYSSLQANTTGGYNTAIGIKALNSNSTGSQNVAVGTNALYSNTTISKLVAVGDSALYHNGTGATNNYHGTKNTALGSNALFKNTTGYYNSAIGHVALYFNTSGVANNALGYAALYSNAAGNRNMAIGNGALYANTGGDENIAIGNMGLSGNTIGEKNTALGYYAGDNITTGSNNLIIGYRIDAPLPTASHQMSIGNLLFATGIDGTGTTISSGNVGIGVANPDAKLEVNGQIRINGGNPGVGKILRSDQNGLASWETIHENNIHDADGNTQIQVEESNNEDKIRFDLAGIEYFVFENGRMNILNTGMSVFIGEGAGNLDDLSDNKNVFVGHQSGQSNTIGSFNTASGFHSFFSNTSGSNNVALGNSALFTNNYGHRNSACGDSSLFMNMNGYDNTAMGFKALHLNTSGHNNTANGRNALHNNQDGDQNTAVGNIALFNNTTGYNNTALGSYAFFSGTAYHNSTAIGSHASISGSNMIRLGNSSVTSIGGYAGWSTISDGRFKRDIREDVVGLEFIKKLRPVTYYLDVDAIAAFNQLPIDGGFRQPDILKASEMQIGFIAQEVEAVAKELGFDFHGIDKPQNSDAHYSLRYAEFVVPIVKAVQEQQQIIEQQQKAIDVLIEEVELLKKQSN